MTVPAIRWDGRPSSLEGVWRNGFANASYSAFAKHALDPRVDTGSRQENASEQESGARF